MGLVLIGMVHTGLVYIGLSFLLVLVKGESYQGLASTLNLGCQHKDMGKGGFGGGETQGWADLWRTVVQELEAVGKSF